MTEAAALEAVGLRIAAESLAAHETRELAYFLGFDAPVPEVDRVIVGRTDLNVISLTMSCADGLTKYGLFIVDSTTLDYVG